MATLQELREAARNHYKRESQALDIPAIIQISDDLPDNKVRVWREDIRQQVVVNGLVRTPGVHCWLREMPNRELQIFAVNVAESTPRFGQALNAILQAQGGDEAAPHSIPGIGFTPGRVEPSLAGGLRVHISAFHHVGGYWRGLPGDDLDLSGAAVTTLDYVRWDRIYFDPVTNSPGEIAGDEVPGPIEALNETQAAAIAIPEGTYPLGAVALSYGQIEITKASRIIDMRFHLAYLQATSSSGVGLDKIMIDANGHLMIDAKGRIMTSA